VDFAKCDQPDELIELAWNAGLDKKAIIREGSDAARLLLAGERNEIVTLFWPVPRPLEAVDRWSENTYSQVSEGLRPFASAVVPGCALGYFITSFFFAPRMSEGSLTAMVWIIVASIVVLGILFKLLIGAALRRRVGRLDEQSALDVVLAQLRRGKLVCPKVVPLAVKNMRRGLAMIRSSRDYA
jgi:hypothetical protein